MGGAIIYAESRKILKNLRKVKYCPPAIRKLRELSRNFLKKLRNFSRKNSFLLLDNQHTDWQVRDTDKAAPTSVSRKGGRCKQKNLKN